jgi:hypothetical protein
MLQVTYNYYGEVRTATLDNITSYFRGKRLVFEGESFEERGKWWQFRIVVRRKSIKLEKAQGHQPDRMYGFSGFKIYSIVNT